MDNVVDFEELRHAVLPELTPEAYEKPASTRKGSILDNIKSSLFGAARPRSATDRGSPTAPLAAAGDRPRSASDRSKGGHIEVVPGTKARQTHMLPVKLPDRPRSASKSKKVLDVVPGVPGRSTHLIRKTH